jgi:sulfoxide reductase heme-binding subunit YedZ
MHVLNDIPVGWWLGRAFGFVAYAALWASILSGLAMSGRGGGIFDPKWVYDVHQETTLMAVLAALGHAVVIVLDTASGVSRFAVLIPFASARLTGPVALGTFALLGLGTVAVSSWLRARIGASIWRAVHAAAFGVWLLGLLHAVLAGSSTGAPGMSALYVGSASFVIGGMVWRVGVTALQSRPQ